MRRGVDEHKHAFGGPALASAAVAGGAVLARAFEPGGAEDALQRTPRDLDALALGQELGEVRIVHPEVAATREREDPLAQRRSDLVRRDPARVAVAKSRGACVFEPRPQPPGLTDGEPEELSRLLDRELAAEHATNDDLALLFLHLDSVLSLPLGTDRVAGHNSLTNSLAVQTLASRA